MAADNEDIVAVKEWLASEVKLERYADKLVSNGFISLKTCCSIDENALNEIGIVLPYHRRRFLGYVEKLREKLGVSLTNEENGVISSTELITHRSVGGNDQSGSLISFDNDGESKEPERSASMQCVNEHSRDVAHVEEDVPKLPPKVSKQSKRSHSGKAPPPPIPPRADLEPEGAVSGEPSRKAVHLDTHVQDLVPVPTHSEKPSTQADAPKKKVPVKPPRGKLKAPQINQSPSENKPAATSMDIQEQVSSSFGDDIAAAFDPLKEPTVDVNLTSAIPDLSKPSDEDVDLKTSNEQAVEERAAPIYGNIKDVESHSAVPIEPTRPTPHAPTRTGSKKPVPVPRSRVKSEDGVLVTTLAPDKKVAGDDNGESSTVLNHSLQARTKSFSTPGNRRLNPPEEKPSTMPRYNPLPKREAPPPPPSRQTGSSLKDKRSFLNMPLPPLPPVDSNEKPQDQIDGAHQKGTVSLKIFVQVKIVEVRVSSG